MSSIPSPLSCPLCGEAAQVYRIAETGLVRCWDCNLRLENFNGRDAAVKAWNRRTGTAPEKPPQVTETPRIVPVEKPKTLEDFITQKLGGDWYAADKAIKEHSRKIRIKKSDYERYKKMYEMQR